MSQHIIYCRATNACFSQTKSLNINENSSREGFFISYFFLLFLLFQDGGPHENDCTTSGNDATAITGDDAIFCDRFSHFLSLYLRLLVFHHCCAML